MHVRAAIAYTEDRGRAAIVGVYACLRKCTHCRPGDAQTSAWGHVGERAYSGCMRPLESVSFNVGRGKANACHVHNYASRRKPRTNTRRHTHKPHCVDARKHDRVALQDKVEGRAHEEEADNDVVIGAAPLIGLKKEVRQTAVERHSPDQTSDTHIAVVK